jgi:hypothetical protein
MKAIGARLRWWIKYLRVWAFAAQHPVCCKFRFGSGCLHKWWFSLGRSSFDLCWSRGLGFDLGTGEVSWWWTFLHGFEDSWETGWVFVVRIKRNSLWLWLASHDFRQLKFRLWRVGALLIRCAKEMMLGGVSREFEILTSGWDCEVWQTSRVINVVNLLIARLSECLWRFK